MSEAIEQQVPFPFRRILKLILTALVWFLLAFGIILQIHIPADDRAKTTVLIAISMSCWLVSLYLNSGLSGAGLLSPRARLILPLVGVALALLLIFTPDFLLFTDGSEGEASWRDVAMAFVLKHVWILNLVMIVAICLIFAVGLARQEKVLEQIRTGYNLYYLIGLVVVPGALIFLVFFRQ